MIDCGRKPSARRGNGRLATLVGLGLLILMSGTTHATHTQWNPIGPAPIQNFFPGGVTGRATALVLNPQNGDQIFMGTAAGGVWYSPNAGDDWYPLSDYEESLAIGAIALAGCTSTGCATVYAGTGENAIRRDTYHGAGLLIGTFLSGANPPIYSWNMIYGDEDVEFRGGSINDVIVHPLTSGANTGIYVSLSSGVTVSATNATVTAPEPSGGYGLYRSNDNGVSWSKISIPLADGYKPTDLKMHPTQFNVMYAGFLGRGIFKSANGGASWCPINDGLDGGMTCWATSGLPDATTDIFDHVEIAIAPSQPERVYATFGMCTDPLVKPCQPAVYSSDNDGLDWTLRRAGSTTEAPVDQNGVSDCLSAYTRYTHALVVHPTAHETLFSGGMRLCHSGDSGETWTLADFNEAPGTAPWGWGKIIHLDHHEIVFDPQLPYRVYSTSDGGFARSSFNGLSWRHHNDDLQITGFHALATSPNGTKVFGTSQDNGGQIWTGGKTWNWTGCCGDGGAAVIDLDTPANMYATKEYGSLYRTTTGGNHWAFSGVTGSGAFYAPIYQDPNPLDPQDPNPQHSIYYGGHRLWRSNDDAATWTDLSPLLSSTSQPEIWPQFNVISSLATAPSNSDRIYLGFYGGEIFMTDNACIDVDVDDNPVCWIKISEGLPAAPVTGIVVHPTDHETVWVSYSGFGAHARVWKTTDSGGEWNGMVTGLPAGVPVNTIAKDYTGPDDLLVGLDSNSTRNVVYRSIDGGASWSAFSQNLPNSPVHDIEVDTPHSRLFVATHGRGAWMRGLAFVFPIENWVDSQPFEFPVIGWLLPPDEVCTIEIFQEDGTPCASGQTDAMGAEIRTNSQGQLVTSAAGQSDNRMMAWGCFDGTCVGGVAADSCDSFDSAQVTCGAESAFVSMLGPQSMTGPQSTMLGIARDVGAGGALGAATPSTFDLVAAVQAADGSTRSLCSVGVTAPSDKPPLEIWDQAADAINASPTCNESGVVGDVVGGLDPQAGKEDDFQPGPWLKLAAPEIVGTQMFTTVHAGPDEAGGECFRWYGLGLPMLNQGQTVKVRFETAEGGASAGEIKLIEETPLGTCAITIPTDVGQTADEIALAVAAAFQAPGIPGPNVDCPSDVNPRDVIARDDSVVVLVASQIEICVDDPGVGFFVGPTDLGNAHPVASCTAQTVECTSPVGATVLLDGSASGDPDPDPGAAELTQLAWFEDYGLASEVLLGTGATLPVPLALGSHDISLLVTDGQGLQSGVDCPVNVVDTTAPVVVDAQIAPATLWPPNHRMVDVTTVVDAVDLCSTPVIELKQASSGEPDDAPGSDDGETADDIQDVTLDTADFALRLRAERDRQGPGRTYTLTYRVVDGSGNISETPLMASVPVEVDGAVEPILFVMRKTPPGALLEWPAVAGAAGYDVIRGDLASILETADAVELGSTACIAAGITNPTTLGQEDPVLPPSGQGFFYLVQFDDSGWGTETTVKPRIVTASGCP